LKLAFGSDHAGAALKTDLLRHAASLGHEVEDLGGIEGQPSDYPLVSATVGEGVVSGRYDRGVLVCGSGLGVSIAANKVPGVRAALCHETYSARMSREHNDANVLCLGQRVVGSGLAREVLGVFLQTAFSGGENHRRRIGQIASYERHARSERR